MRKMRQCLLGAGLLAIIGLGGACSHESSYTSARKTGQKVGEAVATKVQFVDQLSLIDKKQIALGRLALRKSSDTGVRAFAQQLIEHHEQQIASLEQYADASALRLAVIDLSEEEGVGGSGETGTMGAKEYASKKAAEYDEKLDKEIADAKNEVQKLSAKSGPEFNKGFLEQVIKDQKRGSELVDKGLKEYPDDAALATLLGRSAPVFARQQEQARALKESID